MHDREKIIKALERCLTLDSACGDCPYYSHEDIQELDCERNLRHDTLDLLKEQEELLHKLQKDKDKLCLEVSKWKHKFHDAPPKFVPQGVVDQICWERDVALSQLEQIGKGLGSKMDDIVALLKEQEAVEPIKPLDKDDDFTFMCSNCKGELFCGDVLRDNFCPTCGRSVKWNESA